MSRWHRMDGVADLPERAFSENKFTRTFEGGGGGGGTTYSTASSYTSNVPEFAQPFFEEMMQRANLESLQPYEAYTGERTAQFDPLQTQVQQEIADMGPIRYDATTAQEYMDPYMQQVVDIQKGKALEDYQKMANITAAEAAQMGARGGGREAVMQSENQNKALARMNEIQAQGLQQAYAQGFDTLQKEQSLNQQRLGMQAETGKELRAMSQAELDRAYEDFINERDYDRQQLAFYNALLRGVPVPVQQEQVAYQPGGNFGTQLAGAGLAGLGSYLGMGGNQSQG